MFRTCPVCGSRRGFTVFEVARGRDGEDDVIMICRHCCVLKSTALESKRLSHEEEETIQGAVVQEHYAHGAGDDASIREQVAETHPVLDTVLLDSSLTFERRVAFEIGAGAGFLAAAAAEHFDRVFATDLDVSLIEKTKSATGSQNLSILSSIEEMADTGLKSDCTIFWHVLEHIPKPLEFMRQVRRITSGVAYLQVPLFRPQYIFPAHRWFFNFTSIEQLAHASNFKNRKVLFDSENGFMSVVLW